MKDLIVGFASGYDYSKIRTWINSINASSFMGIKALGSYGLSEDTIQKALSAGFHVFDLGPVRRSTVIDRFEDLPLIIQRVGAERVVATDVSDVVFTYNPFTWLNENRHDIIASPEFITYQNQDWNSHNMFHCFGTRVMEKMYDKMVINAGVIAGRTDKIAPMSYMIAGLCNATPNLQADQSAYNIVLRNFENVFHADDSTAWAAQLGVWLHQPSRQNLTTDYVIDGDKVKNKDGKEFCIVHQYNRQDELKSAMERRFL